MGNYYYVRDKDSEFGFTPVPEDDYIQAIFHIAKKRNLRITDKMILAELKEGNLPT